MILAGTVAEECLSGQRPDFKENFRVEGKEVVMVSIGTCFNTLY